MINVHVENYEVLIQRTPEKITKTVHDELLIINSLINDLSILMNKNRDEIKIFLNSEIDSVEFARNKNLTI